MDKNIWQLRLTAKQLETQSKKSKRGEVQDVAKMKKALQHGEIEKARLYATSATRKKNESINTLNMCLRLEAAVSELQSVQINKDVSKKLALTGKEMERAMKKMDLVQVHGVLETFEKQMENSEIRSKYLGTTLGGMVLKEAPAEQVEELLSNAAEEHGLELKNLLPKSASTSLGYTTKSAIDNDEIAERLLKLHNNP